MTGPNPENLRRLAATLPGLAKHNAARGAARATRFANQPHKVCDVCGAMFDMRLVSGEAFVERGFCPACKPLLEAGEVAVVCHEIRRFVFLKAGGGFLPEMAGKLFKVGQAEFLAIEERLKPDDDPPAKA